MNTSLSQPLFFQPLKAASQPDKPKAAPQQTLATTIEDLAKRKNGTVVNYNKFIALIASGNWLYATRPNAAGVVAIMTLIKTKTEEYLVCLTTKRPPMNGQINLEPIAGLHGDTGEVETKKESADRELKEEINLDKKEGPGAISLFDNAIPSSPGMTDEATNYYFTEQTLSDEEVAAIRNHRAEGDGDIIQGQVWIPLKTFIANPLETLNQLAQKAVPTKDMLSGLLLLLGHLQKTGRLKMELVSNPPKG